MNPTTNPSVWHHSTFMILNLFIYYLILYCYLFIYLFIYFLSYLFSYFECFGGLPTFIATLLSPGSSIAYPLKNR